MVLFRSSLNTLIQIQDNTKNLSQLVKQLKLLETCYRRYEKENYSISSNGIRKVVDSGYLSDIAYRVIEDV